MSISTESSIGPEIFRNGHKSKMKRLLGAVGLSLTLAITSAVTKPVSAAAEILSIDNYPYLNAKIYNQDNYDWWMDENGNGVANTPDELNSPLGYGYRNCTDGAAYWTQQYTSVSVSGMGNANTWDDNAMMLIRVILVRLWLSCNQLYMSKPTQCVV